MRLKSFYAKTMTEAMQMVRNTLGEDAVIVATREENGGASVRVTAAIDDSLRASLSAPEARSEERNDWLQYDDEQDDDSSLTETIMDALIKHGAPEDILDHIVNSAALSNVEDPHIAFIAAIDTLFTFQPLPQTTSPKPMMFIGAPGAGKTMTVAKVAARGVMNGLRVGVITTDTARAGALEQLEAFTSLLNIDLKTARNPSELKKALTDLKECQQILIDTAGANPFKTDDMRALAKLMTAGDIEPILVLPAAGDAEESADTARIFSALGVRRFVATRLDIARRLGGLLTAAQRGGLSFSDSCSSAGVADGLDSLSPRRLAGYFFIPNTDDATHLLRTPTSPTSRKKSTG